MFIQDEGTSNQTNNQISKFVDQAQTFIILDISLHPIKSAHISILVISMLT